MSIYSLPANRGAFLGLRLALSAVLLALFLGLVRLAWFPGLYLQLGGISRLILTLTAVILVVGPGLSTLVYRQGKRGLRMDLVIILGVELVVLAYFGSRLLERRPQHLVFAIDRFQVVETSRVADYPYRFAELAGRSFLEPRLVYARFPDDQMERAALKEGILLHGEPDIDVRPDQWYPYDDAVPAVLAAARPLAELQIRGDEYAQAVDRWLSWHSGGPGDYVFLPVAGENQDAVAVLSGAEGHLIDMLDLDPWE